MNKHIYLPSLFVIFLFIACSKKTSDNTTDLKYLALGDSYTIGESVHEYERWPVQLSDSLLQSGIRVSETRIIAETGWTTNELLDSLQIALPETDYNMVSLLIGVNNQYRGYDLKQYRSEFKMLLDKCIAYAGGDTSHVFVLSIPDYGVTPFARKRNPEKIGKELDVYNAIADSISGEYGLSYIEITNASRKALRDARLIAADSLHPSGAMYREWVDAAFETARDILINQKAKD